MHITEAQRIYQANLEAHRVDPDDDLIFDHLQKAATDLDEAWVRHESEKIARELDNIGL